MPQAVQTPYRPVAPRGRLSRIAELRKRLPMLFGVDDAGRQVSPDIIDVGGGGVDPRISELQQSTEATLADLDKQIQDIQLGKTVPTETGTPQDIVTPAPGAPNVQVASVAGLNPRETPIQAWRAYARSDIASGGGGNIPIEPSSPYSWRSWYLNRSGQRDRGAVYGSGGRAPATGEQGVGMHPAVTGDIYTASGRPGKGALTAISNLGLNQMGQGILTGQTTLPYIGASPLMAVHQLGKGAYNLSQAIGQQNMVDAWNAFEALSLGMPMPGAYGDVSGGEADFGYGGGFSGEGPGQ